MSQQPGNASTGKEQVSEEVSRGLAAFKESLFMSIGLANLPEYHGRPSENIEKFLQEFARATTALSPSQKCVALKKSLVGDASIFLKNYLKQLILQGDWKRVKEGLRKRFSLIEPSLLYRSELNKMTFDPKRDTLLGYVDRYANLYKKIHSEVKDPELIQEISLNLGQRIVLKLNQLSANWKAIEEFDTFRELILRLEKDIMALETDLANQTTQDLANTVNQLVTSALQPPLKEFQDLIIRLGQKSNEEPDIENVAAVKHGGYPEKADNRHRNDHYKRKDRDWDRDRDRHRQNKRGPEEERPTSVFKRAKELRRVYEDQIGGSSVGDSGESLTNLGCRNSLTGLIIATVTINNVVANVVIDTGATASFLPSEGIVIKESQPTLVKTKNDTRIADNGQLDCTHIIHGYVRVWASHLRKHGSRFFVINRSSHILGYDALFGNDIIKAMSIDIANKDGQLVARIDGQIIGQEDTIEKHRRHLALLTQMKEAPPSQTPLDSLLMRYSSVFSETAEGCMKTASMKIRLTSTSMPKAKLGRYSVEDVSEIDRQVKSMLDRRIIEPSISDFSSTCHLVPKKTGQKRLVINFIPLNKIAVKDHYPLPQISDLLAHLADAKYFCALDCTEGFWQISVAREDRSNTAFVTPQGLFQFRRCPFGFTNSPGVFQRAMNEIFREGLYKRCVIYIDDILVYGKTQEEVLSNLEWVLRKCDEFNVKLKHSKCEFMKTSVRFLGYKVGQGNIKPLTDKTESWYKTRPGTVKEAQGFLGYIGYYSRFIENYSEKTSIMRKAIRVQPFEWTDDCEIAKNQLLDELNQATSQIIPSTSTPKQIDIAVLDNSIEAACLTDDGKLIMRTSARLSSTQKNYSSLEKELLALVRAYRKFGPHLRGQVTIKTSCTMLPSVLKLKDKPERVARLLLQLPPDAEFQVEATNDVIDTLQRMTQPPDETFYTDGGFRMGPNKIGIASLAVVAVNIPELSCSGIIEDSTNQQAEIEAVIQACQLAKDNKLKNILIVTDSKYVVNAIDKWIDRWQDNGWLDSKHKPVKNMKAFQRLAQVMLDLDLKVAHVHGHKGDKYNEMADNMAREALLPLINTCATIHKPPDLQQDDDEELLSIKQQLQSSKPVLNYKLKDNTLYYEQDNVDKLVVPTKQRQLLLELAHYDPIYGAHYGVKKTRAKLTHYYWPHMGSDITKFIAACETCQRQKDTKQKPYGKLMPIKTSSLFNRVHMDIIGPLTESSSGHKHIITAIDAFSRMGFARPCKRATGEEVAKLLLEEIVSKHGPPEHIVTDNGTQFMSEHFQSLLKKLGTKHSTTCEYNPKANGMDERFNGTLFKIIKNCVGSDRTQWDSKLPGAVLAYNISPHESTKLSPYCIVYGRLPRSPLNPAELEAEPEEAAHDDIRQVASENMDVSVEQMRKQYDKKRQDFTFDMFDQVMVKTLFIDRTASWKFASKWTGPHVILKFLEHDGERKAIEILDTDLFKVRRVAFGAVKPYYRPQPSTGDLPGNVISQQLGNVNTQAASKEPNETHGSSALRLAIDYEPRLAIGHKGVNPLDQEGQVNGQAQDPRDPERGVIPLTGENGNVHPNNTPGANSRPDGSNVCSPVPTSGSNVASGQEDPATTGVEGSVQIPTFSSAIAPESAVQQPRGQLSPNVNTQSSVTNQTQINTQQSQIVPQMQNILPSENTNNIPSIPQIQPDPPSTQQPLPATEQSAVQQLQPQETEPAPAEQQQQQQRQDQPPPGQELQPVSVQDVIQPPSDTSSVCPPSWSTLTCPEEDEGPQA